MFDIGFWELVLVGMIGLIVLGPERLPRAARTLGLWAGRARSYVRHFTAELEREVGAQETREQAQRLVQDVQKAADDPPKPSGE